MRATLVVARGASVFVIAPGALAREHPRRPGGGVPSSVLADLRAVPPSGGIAVGGRELRAELARALGRAVPAADAVALREALRALPGLAPEAEREMFLARAEADLEAALRSPEEILISLAREEERLARSVDREARAAEAFAALDGTVLSGVAASWQRSRTALAVHHRELLATLEAEARRTLPNLSAVVGPRTAGRLAAAAGALGPLARMSASRLQLLGSRRRPSPDRGPRFGVLYLADDLDSVPSDRRGAFARSVAALAAIAARADVLTHRDVAAELVRRREARRDRLNRRRR